MPHPSIGMGSQFKKALIGLTHLVASLQNHLKPEETWITKDSAVQHRGKSW